METTENIIDTTLDIVGSSMHSIDRSFEKIPVYKVGHNLGGKISRWIDKLVDGL